MRYWRFIGLKRRVNDYTDYNELMDYDSRHLVTEYETQFIFVNLTALGILVYSLYINQPIMDDLRVIILPIAIIFMAITPRVYTYMQIKKYSNDEIYLNHALKFLKGHFNTTRNNIIVFIVIYGIYLAFMFTYKG